MSANTSLADYVFAPKLTLERDDVTLLADPWYEAPYSQYSEAIVSTDHDVLEEWEVYWGLGQRLGLDVVIGETHFNSPQKPSKYEVLEAITKDSRVPLAWLRDNPGGHTFPEHKVTVEAANPASAGKLQFYPEGVAEDFAAAKVSETGDDRFTHQLICSRSKYVLNSSGLNLSLLKKKMGTTNPVQMHPLDIEVLGLEEDCLVEVHSEDGKIPGVLRASDRLKRGVVTMHHSWGGIPGEESEKQVRNIGANTNLLVDNLKHNQPYTGMARQSAIPVYITRKTEVAA
jgi:anaerobic selenocysteine-containing dehydrogenase